MRVDWLGVPIASYVPLAGTRMGATGTLGTVPDYGRVGRSGLPVAITFAAHLQLPLRICRSWLTCWPALNIGKSDVCSPGWAWLFKFAGAAAASGAGSSGSTCRLSPPPPPPPKPARRRRNPAATLFAAAFAKGEAEPESRRRSREHGAGGEDEEAVEIPGA